MARDRPPRFQPLTVRDDGATLGGLTHLLVSLRDTDDTRIGAYLAGRRPEVPALLVRGPVCRPEGLIEVEGIAVADNHAPALPRF